VCVRLEACEFRSCHSADALALQNRLQASLRFNARPGMGSRLDAVETVSLTSLRSASAQAPSSSQVSQKYPCSLHAPLELGTQARGRDESASNSDTNAETQPTRRTGGGRMYNVDAARRLRAHEQVDGLAHGHAVDVAIQAGERHDQAAERRVDGDARLCSLVELVDLRCQRRTKSPERTLPYLASQSWSEPCSNAHDVVVLVHASTGAMAPGVRVRRLPAGRRRWPALALRVQRRR